MKKFAIIISFSLFIFSCQKQLDLKPQITEETALQSKENIEKILIGAYATAFAENCFGGASWQIQEILSADNALVKWNAENENLVFIQKSHNPNNPKIETIWKNAYAAVNACNLVIQNGDAKLKAEAQFLRSYIFAELMRLFANAELKDTDLGIPLPLKPTQKYTDNQHLPRLKSTEVWAQINADLESVIIGLDETSLPMRANKLVATALLARTYLYAGEMRKAAEKANEVIISGKYKLETDMSALFSQEKMSEEIVFAVYQAPSKSNFHFKNSTMLFRKGYISQFTGRDRRQEYFKATAETDIFRQLKFENFEHFFPLIRLAEMYLIRAEANFLANTSIGSAPLNDMNVLKNRVRASGLTAISEEEIQNERLLELDFEGHRLYDLKRYKKNISANVSYSEPKLVLPIPFSEISNNKNMVQNPNY